jgi:hypothetical protein
VIILGLEKCNNGQHFLKEDMNMRNGKKSMILRLAVAGIVMAIFMAVSIPPGWAKHGRPDPNIATMVYNPARLAVLKKGLGFPFKKIRKLSSTKAYGIAPWGGEAVHNGIDLIADNINFPVGSEIDVISPVKGTVVGVIHTDNPHAPDLSQWILVLIEVTPSTWVTLSFEPKSAEPGLQVQQEHAIAVVEGQRVRKGQLIGRLTVGEGDGSGSGSGNPHIDFRLLLKPIDMNIEDLMAPDVISHNDVYSLPTFLCPYDYSTARAKNKYEDLIFKSDPETSCMCPCKFPYNDEKCGDGCVD